LSVAVTKEDPSAATVIRFCVEFASDHSENSVKFESWTFLFVVRTILFPSGMILRWLTAMVVLDAIPRPENAMVLVLPPPVAAKMDLSAAMDISVTGISMFRSQIMVPVPEMRRTTWPRDVRI
jgi:hypothetical protein